MTNRDYESTIAKVFGDNSMADAQAFEAWAKDKPIEVFWSYEAWKAALTHERMKKRNVPGGWKLVPIDPTPEMLKAAFDGDVEYSLRNFGPNIHMPQGGYDHWIAMISAAQEPITDAERQDLRDRAVGMLDKSFPSTTQR